MMEVERDRWVKLVSDVGRRVGLSNYMRYKLMRAVREAPAVARGTWSICSTELPSCSTNNGCCGCPATLAYGGEVEAQRAADRIPALSEFIGAYDDASESLLHDIAYEDKPSDDDDTKGTENWQAYWNGQNNLVKLV